jgi:DNA-binding transcriptional LysR family regulator
MNVRDETLPALLNRLRMRQTALLLAIEETGTLGAAAQQLGMTQPAATKMLHELENTLGTTLFDRVGRKILINEAGRKACLSFRGMQGTLKQLQHGLAQLREGSIGHLAIGSIMAASPTYLSGALALLKQEHPGLNVRIEVGTHDQLLQQLDDGELDMVIGQLPAHQGLYRFRALSHEPIAVVCATDHPLAGRRKLAFAQIGPQSWVLQPEGTPLRELLTQEFALHHTALPTGALVTSSTMITMHIVARTQTLAALPTPVAQAFKEHGMLGILDYRMRHKLANYGSVVRADRPVSAQTERFIKLLHQQKRIEW